MGTLAIAYLIWILTAIVAFILKLFTQKSRRLRKSYKKLKNKLFYNSLISLFLESYSLISVCCLINLSFISIKSYGVTVHSMTCIFFFAAIILMPLILTWYLVAYFGVLRSNFMLRQFGHFYEDLDLR